VAAVAAELVRLAAGDQSEAAKALGLTIWPTLHSCADELIA
jgi:hypothetical protein